MTSWRIIEGDCRAVMHSLMAESVDAVVCDPPYGLEFMGKEWDGANGFRRSLNIADVDRPNVFGRSSRTGPEYRAGVVFQEWCNAWATEALRVLKPGGHLVAFGGPRTYHRLACGIEDAGFEIRDKLSWLFGSGFPKSLDVSKAIETHAGVLTRSWATGAYGTSITDAAQATLLAEIVRRGEIQAEHDGAGTALKPGHEPICLARKPFRGNVAANVLAHGTGGLNVDGCRLPTVSAGPGTTPPTARGQSRTMEGADIVRSGYDGSAGRWPSNVVLDEDAAAELDAQTGVLHSQDPATRRSRSTATGVTAFGTGASIEYADSGGASRFYYCAKASSAERGGGNTHPTVKPIDLMRWLCRLVTPKGGTILDPFTGSGTTGIAALREGLSFIGIEREAEYVRIARDRIIGDSPMLNTAAEMAA